MNGLLQSKKAISTFAGAALGVAYVVACHFDDRLIQLNGFAIFVIGLFASHVVGQSFIDHRNAGNPGIPIIPTVQTNQSAYIFPSNKSANAEGVVK